MAVKAAVHASSPKSGKKPGRQPGVAVKVDKNKLRLRASITTDIVNKITQMVKSAFPGDYNPEDEDLKGTWHDEREMPYEDAVTGKKAMRHPIAEGIAINLGYISSRFKPTAKGAEFVNRLPDYKATKPVTGISLQERIRKQKEKLAALEKQMTMSI